MMWDINLTYIYIYVSCECNMKMPQIYDIYIYIKRTVLYFGLALSNQPADQPQKGAARDQSVKKAFIAWTS